MPPRDPPPQGPQTAHHRLAPVETSTATLLTWASSVLALHPAVERLEQLGTGAVFCQLVDCYRPNSVTIQKVNFHATDEHEVLQNWKQFQCSLEPAQLPLRGLDVARLSKGSPAENLELLQWTHRHLAGLLPQPGYDPEARRALSIRGGTSYIPVPKACRHSNFSCYGSARSSPRTSSTPTSGGKSPMAHVPSKWRANFAPPCLSPRSPNPSTPVPVLVTGSPRNRSARPTVTAPGDNGAALHLVNVDGHQVLALGYLQRECRATQTDELRLEQWQQLATVNSKASDGQPVAEPIITDAKHLLDTVLPGQGLGQALSRAAQSFLGNQQMLISQQVVLAEPCDSALSLPNKIGKTSDDGLIGPSKVDWSIAALEASTPQATTSSSTPRAVDAVPVGAVVARELPEVHYSHDDALSDDCSDSVSHTSQLAAGTVIQHDSTTTEGTCSQPASTAVSTTKDPDGPFAAHCLELNSTNGQLTHKRRVSTSSSLSDPPVDGQLDCDLQGTELHASQQSLKDNAYAASVASGLCPGDSSEDEDTLDRSVSETYRSRSMSCFSSLAGRDSSDMSSVMPRVRSRLMHCQVGGAAGPSFSGAGGSAAAGELGAWEHVDEDGQGCDPERSKLSAYQNVYSTDAEGMVHVHRQQQGQSSTSHQARGYEYTSSGGQSSDEEEAQAGQGLAQDQEPQTEACSADAQPALAVSVQHQPSSVESVSTSVQDGAAAQGVFLTVVLAETRPLSHSGSHASSQDYLRDDLSHASTQPRSLSQSAAKSFDTPSELAPTQTAAVGHALGSLSVDALSAALLTSSSVLVDQRTAEPDVVDQRQEAGLGSDAASVQSESEGNLAGRESQASEHKELHTDDEPALRQDEEGGEEVVSGEGDSSGEDSDALTDPEDEQAYNLESPGQDSSKAEAPQWNVFNVAPDDGRPVSSMMKHVGLQDIESRPASMSYSHLAVHNLPDLMSLRTGSLAEAGEVEGGPEGSVRSMTGSEVSWTAGSRPSQLRNHSNLHVLEEHPGYEDQAHSQSGSESDVVEHESGYTTTSSTPATNGGQPSPGVGTDSADLPAPQDACSLDEEAARADEAMSADEEAVSAGGDALGNESSSHEHVGTESRAVHGLESPDDSMIFSAPVEEDLQTILHEESHAVDPDHVLEDGPDEDIYTESCASIHTSTADAADNLAHSHEVLGLDVFSSEPLTDEAAQPADSAQDNQEADAEQHQVVEDAVVPLSVQHSRGTGAVPSLTTLEVPSQVPSIDPVPEVHVVSRLASGIHTPDETDVANQDAAAPSPTAISTSADIGEGEGSECCAEPAELETSAPDGHLLPDATLEGCVPQQTTGGEDDESDSLAEVAPGGSTQALNPHSAMADNDSQLLHNENSHNSVLLQNDEPGAAGVGQHAGAAPSSADESNCMPTAVEGQSGLAARMSCQAMTQQWLSEAGSGSSIQTGHINTLPNAEQPSYHQGLQNSMVQEGHVDPKDSSSPSSIEAATAVHLSDVPSRDPPPAVQPTQFLAPDAVTDDAESVEDAQSVGQQARGLALTPHVATTMGGDPRDALSKGSSGLLDAAGSASKEGGDGQHHSTGLAPYVEHVGGENPELSQPQPVAELGQGAGAGQVVGLAEQDAESEGYGDSGFESEEHLQEDSDVQAADRHIASSIATSSSGGSEQQQQEQVEEDGEGEEEEEEGYEQEEQQEQSDSRHSRSDLDNSGGGSDASDRQHGGSGTTDSSVCARSEESGTESSQGGSASGGSEAGRRASQCLEQAMSQRSSSSIHETSDQASDIGETPAPRVPSDHQADFALPDSHATVQPVSAAQLGSPSHHSSADGRVFKMGEYQYRKLRNGDVFKGRRVNSHKEGPGVYMFVNGDRFEGEFEADLMSGHGVYTFSQEGRYEGGWQSATYHHAGMETFSHGSKYCGQYHLGLRSGWGSCSFFNGDVYEGQWLNGLRHGWGLQQCSDASSYVGRYLHGKRHGHGLYTFPNGDQYAGEYKDDLPNGHGVYMFANGQSYAGTWSEGRKSGWSTFCVETGTLWAAYWQEGKATWVESIAALEARQALEKPEVGPSRANNSFSSLPTSDSPGSVVNVSGMKAEQQLEAARGAQAAAEQVANVVKDKAMAHDDEEGDVQQALQAAVKAAQTAASKAQDARMEALFIAQSLDSAMTLARAPGAPHLDANQ